MRFPRRREQVLQLESTLMTWIHYYLHYRHTAKKTRTNVSKRYTKSDSRNVKSIPNFKRATPNIEVSTTQEPQPAYTTHHALPISSSTPASDPAQIPAASEPSPHSPPSRRPMTQTATSRAVAWETKSESLVQTIVRGVLLVWNATQMGPKSDCDDCAASWSYASYG